MNSSSLDIVDPRIRDLPSFTPAQRLESLAGRRILMLDNGKVNPQFGHFEAAFDVIERNLENGGVGPILRQRYDLLQYDDPRIAALAVDIVGTADAVILGVCDTGVSAPTAMLTAALERQGIPTVTLCQGVGLSVARAMADTLCPGVPMPTLATWRLSSYAEVAEAAQVLWPQIRDGLTNHKPRPASQRSNPLQGRWERRSSSLDWDFTNAMLAAGYGDGLPLVAPTRERVDTMLASMKAESGEVVWGSVPQRPDGVKAEAVAALAVMAGCPPKVGPIVIEAFRCMAQPEFRLFQAAITTHPCGTLVLVKGPAAERSGMTGSFGCLGPGNQANATIGRAVALSYSVLLDMRPGKGDITLQGSPAEYSYCTAENAIEDPWADDHSAASTVLVLKCEGAHNVMDASSTTAKGILTTVADTASALGGNNLYDRRAQTVVFLNPEHARIIANEGWSRRDVQMFLFEKARRKKSDLVVRGIHTTAASPWIDEDVPIVETPSDILVVVAGAFGPQSQVAIPWGYSRGVTRSIAS